MHFVVYIAINTDGVLYIGQTNNIERRLSQHNDPARPSWASRRGPWNILYKEFCPSRSAAMKKERALKLLKKKNSIVEYIQRQTPTS